MEFYCVLNYWQHVCIHEIFKGFHLHWTRKYKAALSPVPSEFSAVQVYFPLLLLFTLCRTKDWLLTIIPADLFVWSSLSSNFHPMSVTEGFAMIAHSKYTSFPSWIWECRSLLPSFSVSWGTSETDAFLWLWYCLLEKVS